MRILEVRSNVLSVPQGYTLVGAFSADLNCNVGIQKAFDQVFDIMKRYRMNNVTVGNVYRIDNLYMLIVKDSSYDNPNIDMLDNSLRILANVVNTYGIKKLAMPKICTGKNGIAWTKVRELIEKHFNEIDGDILVCSM